MTTCPSCGSERVRRGGRAIWMVYLALIAAALPAVFVFELNAALIGAIMLAVIVIAHLAIDTRICLACGHQWKP